MRRRLSKPRLQKRSRLAPSQRTWYGSLKEAFWIERRRAGTSVTGSRLRNRDRFFLSVPSLLFLESLFDPLHEGISERNPRLVPSDVALLVQLLHQASGMFSRTPHYPAHFVC